MLTYRRTAWLKILFSARGTFVRGVPLRVLTFGMIALAVTVVHRYTHVQLQMPVGLHEVGGAVVALILAFRANTAYARYWEARTVWGNLVNASRNLGRLIDSQTTAHAAERRTTIAWIIVFAHAVRARLRDESAGDDLKRLLAPKDVDALLACPHPALAAADQLSSRLSAMARRGAIDPLLNQRADVLVGELVNCLGGCERIRNTPTPLGYILLFERFLAIYLASLPFALVGRAGWVTALVTVLVAYPVLMFDALAIELDDPFGHDPNDLPLTRITDTIERNLLDLGLVSEATDDVVAEID